MKKIYNIILCGLALAATSSCNKFLDVNNVNPNSPTSTSVDVVLPQALAATANTSVTFNSYGAWVGGYQANAGGFGGFGSVLTYNYTTSDNNGLWSQSYENINDYQYIINNSATTGTLKNFNAVARVMKVFAYQRLVDLYGDVPYTDAVRGLGNLTPKYDKAEAIYTDLFKQLDTAVTTMNIPSAKATQLTLGSGVNGVADITRLSGGDGDGFNMAGWIRFANTLRLRLLIRIQNVPTMAAVISAEKAKLAALTGANFVSADVNVQPGYVKVGGKQNPAYNAYAFNADGTATQISTLPTLYSYGFYNGVKLYDATRRALTYQNTTAFNQLGYTGSDAPTSPSGGNWLVAGKGILKGLDAPYPIMLASESYFLQAEANLAGILPGTAATNWRNGIFASYKYLHTLNTGAVEKTDAQINTEVDAYITSNTTTVDDVPKPYLGSYGLATTDAQRLESIITQKWIALTYVTSNESWAEFRRTGYPTVTPQAYVNPSNGAVLAQLDPEYYTFASSQSTSPRADKLPVRVLYPQSEYSLNSSNAPTGINTFNSRIFWDLN